jgi:hypothetical protein
VTAGTEPERNAAAEPQTEARTFCAFQMSTNGQAGCDVGRSEISEGQTRHLRPAGSGETDSFKCLSSYSLPRLSKVKASPYFLAIRYLVG